MEKLLFSEALNGSLPLYYAIPKQIASPNASQMIQDHLKFYTSVLDLLLSYVPLLIYLFYNIFITVKLRRYNLGLLSKTHEILYLRSI